MGTKEIELFEDLLSVESPQNVANDLDKIQNLIVCNCLEVYSMIPELYTTLQVLKNFFEDLEELKRVKS
jgi:hypothetical protein